MNDAMRKVPEHLFFSSGLLSALVAEAKAASPLEIGGLLLGRKPRRVGRFVSLPNAAHRPDEHFRADGSTIARTLGKARGSGWRVEGLFHSHPFHASLPSFCDLEHCMEDLPLLLLGRSARAHRGFIRRGSTWLEIGIAALHETAPFNACSPLPAPSGRGTGDVDRDFI